jgi:hypothetical protein
VIVPDVDGKTAVQQVLTVLREAVEGPSGPTTYFIDKKPDAGLLGALGAVSAEQASRSWGDTSIAAHAHHIAFAMADSAAIIEGARTPPDWKESWSVSTVDDARWRDLVSRVRSQYDRLRRAVESRAASSGEVFGEAAGALAHIAYHLGAIRQKIAALRAR